MIPKKIHYCWLSGDEFPPLIQKCIATWKDKLPDYEFILWDSNKFNLDSNKYTKQAFEEKKYAFAADYIRLFALYHHGGIYLDTDIEVLKSFDGLLHLPYFIGTEGNEIIEAGVFGAEKGTDWVDDCLRFYDNKPFDKNKVNTLPRVMMKQIQEKKSIKELNNDILPKDVSYTNDNQLYMFPKDYFCAKNHSTGIIEKTNNTFCIHHFAMSWIPKEIIFLSNFKKYLMRVFGVKFITSVISMLHLYKVKEKFER